ncbi:MAG: hypothetical protein GWN86_26285 [Desulfobacterales bacterium]|nr:hypothetical protein [Desulfobacterales bacterium]
MTVKDVARDLACPCQCPLILQDCNMSCGLEWKEEVGQLIAQGKTKQEIVEYFIAKYGDDARLTPLQKIYGKVYQYTRGFGIGEWTALWAAAAVWMIFMFLLVYLVVRKFSIRSNTR